MESNKIAKKSVLYFIGNFSSKILASLLVPLYAFYISKEILGIYDYSQTIMNILIPVAFISIWEAIIRFILGEQKEETKIKAYATSAVFTFAICLLICLGTIIVSSFIQIQYKEYFILMVCSSALAQIWQYFSRAKEDNKLFVKTGVISTLINVILNVVFIVIFKWQADALYVSFIVSQIVIFILIEKKIKIIETIKRENLDFKLLKLMLLYSAPLVVNSIASWILNGFGRVIIFDSLGAEENGLYSFANKFTNIFLTIGNVITMALLEEAMIALRDKELMTKFTNIIQKIFEIFLVLLLLIMPAISIFYVFIKNTEYSTSIYLLPILLLYSVFLIMSTNLGIIFKVVNKNKHQVTTTVLSSIVMIIFSYIFLNSLGIYSVIIGQLLSSVVMLMSRYYISKKFVNYKINWKPIIALIILYSVISLISLYANLIVVIFTLIIIFIIVIIKNKELIRTKLKKGKNMI